jgi:5,5'-dehydrodivanillate O-demethylase
MRRRLLEEADVVARGGEPKALIRDASENGCVRLPIIGRQQFVDGYPLAEGIARRERTPGLLVRHDFIFQAGQPEEIRLAYRRAMGLDAATGP